MTTSKTTAMTSSPAPVNTLHEVVAKYAEMEIESLDKDIAKFLKTAAVNLITAIEWDGMQAMTATCLRESIASVKAVAEIKGYTTEELQAELITTRDEIVQSILNHSPSQSTSPMHNLADAAKLEARKQFGKWIERVLGNFGLKNFRKFSSF